MRVNTILITILCISAIQNVVAQGVVYEQNDISVHLYHIIEPEPKNFHYATGGEYTNGEYIFGVAYRFINTDYIDLGVITTKKPFPTHDSVFTNFFVKSKIELQNITIEYAHISNGFGLLYQINPGYDQLSVHINF